MESLIEKVSERELNFFWEKESDHVCTEISSFLFKNICSDLFKNISSALQKNCDEKLIFFIISVWCVFIVNENDDSFLECTLLLEFLKKNKHKLTELVSWVKRPIWQEFLTKTGFLQKKRVPFFSVPNWIF